MGTFLLILVVIALITFAAICSGLNVTLMSLQPADLKRKAKLGDARARRILPLRENVHLTLSSILLTNVAAASATPLVLNTNLSGLAAGAISTISLVIFSEILPQALFARHSLTVFSFFSPLIKLMVILTYPVSKPLQLLLDIVLGKQGIQLHTRHELGLIVGEHLHDDGSELDEDEVEIMQGALSLSSKRVRDIMTPMRQVYWMTPDTVIDAAKIDEIKDHSWSRIPIFNRGLTRCDGILLMKDLVDLDFDEQPRLVKDLSLHGCKVIGSMTALDTMFRKFIGAKSHMMPVERDGKIVGIATIEDLIEEILGHEIEDESDHSHPR